MTTEKSHLCTHKLVLTSEGSIWDFPNDPVAKEPPANKVDKGFNT